MQYKLLRKHCLSACFTCRTRQFIVSLPSGSLHPTVYPPLVPIFSTFTVDPSPLPLS